MVSGPFLAALDWKMSPRLGRDTGAEAIVNKSAHTSMFARDEPQAKLCSRHHDAGLSR